MKQILSIILVVFLASLTHAHCGSCGTGDSKHEEEKPALGLTIQQEKKVNQISEKYETKINKLKYKYEYQTQS
jgi:hypothetical protein